jgi:hypothetical protein
MGTDSVADELWGKDWEAGKKTISSNTFCNTSPTNESESETAPDDAFDGSR